MSARDVLRRLTPAWLLRTYRRRRLVEAAGRLRRTAERPTGPEAWWDALDAEPWFAPLQSRDEIIRFLTLLRGRGEEPRAICEIGVAQGGTSFLLAQAAAPDAVLVLVDRIFEHGRDQALRRFARVAQRIICIEGDSHDPDTVARVSAALQERRLDVLLIDADHSLPGVTGDFRRYAPLVRPSGIIAFHDIVQDHRVRRGTDTGRDAGEVALFWRDLDPRYGAREEIIADPEQDGGGIGVLYWEGVGSRE